MIKINLISFKNFHPYTIWNKIHKKFNLLIYNKDKKLTNIRQKYVIFYLKHFKNNVLLYISAFLFLKNL